MFLISIRVILKNERTRENGFKVIIVVFDQQNTIKEEPPPKGICM